MSDISKLLDNNRDWVAAVEGESPGFFTQLAAGQAPEYLWIGCADSRVPATQVTGTKPGELFVHRSVANVVELSDPNCMSALQYAVLALKVRHVIVCGHYGCGGVQGALLGGTDGAVADWLRPVVALAQAHAAELDNLDEASAVSKLCELNVQRSVQAVCDSDAVKTAWANGQALSVHAWIFDLASGRLRSLQDPISAPA